MSLVRFHLRKWVHLSSLRKIAHKGLHIETRGFTLAQPCRAFNCSSLRKKQPEAHCMAGMAYPHLFQAPEANHAMAPHFIIFLCMPPFMVRHSDGIMPQFLRNRSKYLSDAFHGDISICIRSCDRRSLRRACFLANIRIFLPTNLVASTFTLWYDQLYQL